MEKWISTTQRIHMNRLLRKPFSMQFNLYWKTDKLRSNKKNVRIGTLLCEIAGQLYKETNAKTQIAAQIARKRVSLMKPQDAFNAAYFSELIDAVSLHVGGGVVLHTKTETDICESEDKPNGSPENSETDSFRNWTPKVHPCGQGEISPKAGGGLLPGQFGLQGSAAWTLGSIAAVACCASNQPPSIPSEKAEQKR